MLQHDGLFHIKRILHVRGVAPCVFQKLRGILSQWVSLFEKLFAEPHSHKRADLSMPAAVLFLRVHACCNFGSEGGNFERKPTALYGRQREGALETREISFILMRFYSKYSFRSLRDIFPVPFLSPSRVVCKENERVFLNVCISFTSGHGFLIMRRRRRYFIKFLKLLKKQRIFIAQQLSKPGKWVRLMIFGQRLTHIRRNPFVEGFYEARLLLLGIIKGGSQHLSLQIQFVCAKSPPIFAHALPENK